MLRLQREKHTGVLHLRSGDVDLRVFFRRGSAVWAEGGVVGDTLGRMLLERGVIDEGAYEAAIATLKEADAGDDMRLGYALVQAGHLTGEGVSEALGLQVTRKLGRGLAMRDIHMAYKPLDELPKGTPRFPVRVERAVLAATKRHFGSRGSMHYIGALKDQYLALTHKVDDVTDRYGLNGREARFLANLNGAVQTSRVLRGAQATRDFDPAVLIAALVLGAEVAASSEPHAAEADAAPQSQRAPRIRAHASGPVSRFDQGDRKSNPGELPNVGRRTDLSPASEAPISRRPSHISTMPPSGPISSPNLRARISQMSMEAVEIPPARPSTPAPRRPAAKGRVAAEQAFQRGLRHMRAENWPKAADEMGAAVAAMPDAVEYQLYSAWASYRTCAIEEERSVLRMELENLARGMAKEDRNHGFPPYVLAHLALVEEDLERALKLFSMASKRDRKNRDAERHVRLLQRRIEKQRASKLSR